MINKPDFYNSPTVGQVYNYAMSITSQEDADSFFEELIQYMMNFHHIGRNEAEHAAKSNIGYWSGYCDNETAIRMNKLFGASHPYLGVAPFIQTTQEIVNIGYETGRNATTTHAPDGVDRAGL